MPASPNKRKKWQRCKMKLKRRPLQRPKLPEKHRQPPWQNNDRSRKRRMKLHEPRRVKRMRNWPKWRLSPDQYLNILQKQPNLLRPNLLRQRELRRRRLQRVPLDQPSTLEIFSEPRRQPKSRRRPPPNLLKRPLNRLLKLPLFSQRNLSPDQLSVSPVFSDHLLRRPHPRPHPRLHPKLHPKLLPL